MKSYPILRVHDIKRSLTFYNALGFSQKWIYRPFPDQADPAYCCVEKEGCAIHLSSHSGDGAFGSAVFIECDNVDEIYDSLKGSSEEFVSLPPTNQTWNQREFYVTDPDNHSIRFCAPIPKEASE